MRIYIQNCKLKKDPRAKNLLFLPFGKIKLSLHSMQAKMQDRPNEMLTVVKQNNEHRFRGTRSLRADSFIFDINKPQTFKAFCSSASKCDNVCSN